MILVTGGTGMVGAHLLLACVKNNFPVRALYRSASRLQEVADFFSHNFPDQPTYFEQIQWHQTDLNDIVNLEKAFDNIDQIYHCAAKVSFASYHNEKLIKTNREGTENLVNLAVKYKVKKMAYVSSIAALGVEPTVKKVNEDFSWNPSLLHTPYAYSKYGAELEVWRGSQEGLEVVIVNPGIILGGYFWNRSSGTLIKRVAKGMNFYPLGNAGVVALEDVVHCLIKLMNSPIKNERFILVSKNIPYQNLIQKIALQLGVSSPKIPLTKSLLYTLFILDKVAYALGLKKSFLNQATVESLCSKQTYDGSKIEEKLDFKYKPIDAVLAAIGKAYKASH